MTESVVISGGEGDIAQGLRKELEKNGYRVFAPGRQHLDVKHEWDARHYMEEHKPDILINNAGVFYPMDVSGGKSSLWVETLFVNLIGAYYCSRHAIRSGCTRVINIGASSALDARYKGFSGYNASKAGLVALTKSLSLEGVLSVCVSPGRTDTRMRESMAPGEDKRLCLTVGELAREVVFVLSRIGQLNGCEMVIKKIGGGGICVYHRMTWVDWGERWIH